jgi:nitroreductase
MEYIKMGGQLKNYKQITDKDLLALIKKRRSIRKYKNILIKKEDLLELVEAGIYAPSGANTQCYRFFLTENKEIIKNIGELRFKPTKIKTGNRIFPMSSLTFKDSPAIIVVFADWEASWNNYPKKSKLFHNLPYWDCGAAIQNILLLAESKGISSCWISMHPDMSVMKYLKKILNITETYEPMGMIVLGYPNEKIDYEKDVHQKNPIKRKSLEFYLIKQRRNNG